jgi:hypothetical protein
VGLEVGAGVGADIGAGVGVHVGAGVGLHKRSIDLGGEKFARAFRTACSRLARIEHAG